MISTIVGLLVIGLVWLAIYYALDVANKEQARRWGAGPYPNALKGCISVLITEPLERRRKEKEKR